MFEFSQSKRDIVIKRNNDLLEIGVIIIILTIAGILLLFGLLPFEESYTLSNIFGLILLCILIIVLLSIGAFVFVSNSKQITMNDDGILCSSWFGKKFIKWEDVKDWGVSYCGQTRWEGNTYYLYFSEQECLMKNYCAKKLKWNMIRTFFIENDYSEVISKIIPFCKEKTEINPFLGKHKHQFV